MNELRSRTRGSAGEDAASSSITKGAANFTIDDEVYWDLHLMPDAQILASTMQPVRPARGAASPR